MGVSREPLRSSRPAAWLGGGGSESGASQILAARRRRWNCRADATTVATVPPDWPAVARSSRGVSVTNLAGKRPNLHVCRVP